MKIAAVSIALIALLFAGPALFAKGSRDVELREDTVFQGKPLPAGPYTLSWSEKEGGLVDVEIRNGKKVLAAATATREPLDRPSDLDGIVFRTGPNGLRELSRILISGEKQAICLDSGARAELK